MNLTYKARVDHYREELARVEREQDYTERRIKDLDDTIDRLQKHLSYLITLFSQLERQSTDLLLNFYTDRYKVDKEQDEANRLHRELLEEI